MGMVVGGEEGVDDDTTLVARRELGEGVSEVIAKLHCILVCFVS